MVRASVWSTEYSSSILDESKSSLRLLILILLSRTFLTQALGEKVMVFIQRLRLGGTNPWSDQPSRPDDRWFRESPGIICSPRAGRSSRMSDSKGITYLVSSPRRGNREKGLNPALLDWGLDERGISFPGLLVIQHMRGEPFLRPR